MSLLRAPHDQTPVPDVAVLATRWREVIRAESYRSRCLWLLFLDPLRRPAGPVLRVEDLPDGPYDLDVDDLAGLCREILDGPGRSTGPGSVALLLSRPGGAPWTVSDRAWGRFLTRVAASLGGPDGGPAWPVRFVHRYGTAEAADLLVPNACSGSSAG